MAGNPVSTCQIDGQTDLPPPSCGIYIFIIHTVYIPNKHLKFGHNQADGYPTLYADWLCLSLSLQL